MLIKSYLLQKFSITLNFIKTFRKHGTNPYQRVIEVLGHTMQSFITADSKVNHKYLKTASKLLGNAKNASNMSIPCFGFGDSITKDHSVFPLKENGEPCYSFSDVMSSYKSTVARVTLGGPTNFAPIINKTISIVKETKRFLFTIARFL